MKAALFLLTVAGAALAQDMSGQPECATACISAAVTDVGCEGNDTGCQCSGPSQAAIAASALSCLTSECSPEELIQAQQAGEEMCSSFSETATETGATATSTSGTGTETTGTATEDQQSTFTSTEMATTTMTDDAGNTITTEIPETTVTGTNAAAAATPALLGAGAVMGVLGVVAAL